MKKGYILLIAFFSLTLIAANIQINNREGINKISIDIKDGETYSFENIIENEKKGELININSIPNFNNAILRSFETDSNNAIDLVTYVNYISEDRNFGYWSVIPKVLYEVDDPLANIPDPTYVFTGGRGFNHSSNFFMAYYRNLFTNKVARSILFKHALNIVSNLCKSYPSDFKVMVLKEIDKLITFTYTLDSTSPSIDTDEYNDYWKGFIFRRNKLDKIPSTEIFNSLLNAKEVIKNIDVSNQADAMYEFTINEKIIAYFASEKTTLRSKMNAKEIYFDHTYAIKKVKLLKDNTGEYYQIIGIKNNSPINYLFDNKLNRIN
jgi:hypothetical protein